MEAMYYTGREFIGANLPECLWRRADRGNWSARELWYGYDMSPDVNVRLKFIEQNQIEMVIRYISDGDRIEVYLGSSAPGQGNRMDAICQYSKTGFSQVTGRSVRIIASSHPKEIMEYFNRSVLVDPSIKKNVRQIEGSYLNVVKLSEEISSDLAKRTAEIYRTEPSWEFLPHQDYSPDTPSRFAILEGKRRVFFDNFGDGFHYGLAILAVAKTRTNTSLFIEEIESHQHPEAIGKLISNLVEIAEMNNLQLFVTTHNRFVWRCLEREFEADDEKKTPLEKASSEDKRNKSLRVYLVMNDKNTGIVDCTPLTREDADEFWSAADKELYGLDGPA
jgi:hypothetical protein